MLYPIYLYPEDNGGFSGVFPDMQDVVFSGPGFFSTHDAARKVARDYFAELGLEGKSRPEPSLVYDIPDVECFVGGLWSAVYVSEL